MRLYIWNYVCLGLMVTCATAQAATIRLVGGEIDTDAIQMATAASLEPYGDGAGQAMAIVQFAGPIRPEWLKELEEAGAVPQHYLPDFAYLVRLQISAIETIKQANGVRWVGHLPVRL